MESELAFVWHGESLSKMAFPPSLFLGGAVGVSLVRLWACLWWCCGRVPIRAVAYLFGAVQENSRRQPCYEKMLLCENSVRL